MDERTPSRMRSPGYPSTPIGEALELAEKIYRAERTNAIDRAVAAQAMGLSGVTGHSAKLLSNLSQYGFLERAGNNEVRITARAVAAFLPDNESERIENLKAAMNEPPLFNRIQERFPDGLPSQNALRAYLLKEEFTDAAIPAAARAYLSSYEWLQQTGACDSHGRWNGLKVVPSRKGTDEVPGPPPEVLHVRHYGAPESREVAKIEQPPLIDPNGPVYTFGGGKVVLAGTVLNQTQADQVIAFMTAIRPMLPLENKRKDKSAMQALLEDMELDEPSGST